MHQNVALDAWVENPHGRDMPAAFSIAIVIGSGVLYHLAQKGVGSARPWPMLVVAYGLAFGLALVLAVADSPGGQTEPGRDRSIGAGLLLGLAAFGIEAGVFYIYRAGWPLASASVIVNVAVTLVLAAIGIVAFGEHLTVVRALGIGLAAAGAAMIVAGTR